jgi:hypothetical protein
MSDYIKGGATVWARQTIDSEIFFYKPDKWFKMWFFVVNKVNYRDTKLFKRGSNLITYQEIMNYSKATKGQVDKFIRFIKKNEMASTRKTTRGMVLTVLNYDKYQGLENYRVDTQDDLRSKPGRNGVDTINNNDNNINNIKTISPEVKTSAPPILQIPLISKNGDNPKFYPIYQNEIDEWKTDFPAVDILQTLKTIKQWNISNPKNRKTEAGIRRHITGWLSKEQNKAPRVGGKDKYANL